MSSQGRASTRFTLNGQRYELGREDVESRLADVAPDAIRKHAVRVNGTWFPAIQAFEVATKIPRSEFISEHVHQIRTQLGIYTDSARSRAANWLRAILAVLGRPELGQVESLDHAQVSTQLEQAGLSQQDADGVAHGIANDRPGDPDGPVLRTLARHGVNLQELSEGLAAQHEPRLAIRVAHNRLKQWLDRYGSRLVAVLNEKGLEEDAAKAEVAGMRVPADLDFALDPPPEEYLSPVLTALTQQGLDVATPALVPDAATTLASLCRWDPTELDERVLALYDDEARAARLRDLITWNERVRGNGSRAVA